MGSLTVYQRPSRWFSFLDYFSRPFDVKPTPTRVFQEHRDMLCEAQNLINKSLGYDEVNYAENECPCYLCGGKVTLNDDDDNMEDDDDTLRVSRGSFCIANIFLVCDECSNIDVRRDISEIYELLEERGIEREETINYRHNVRSIHDNYQDYDDNYEGFLNFLRSLN